MDTEPDQVSAIKHRYSRALEISVAYRSFNLGEVETGNDKSCVNTQLRRQVTHTLLITYYSYIYSLFDPSGINFIDVYKSIQNNISEEAKYVAKIAIEEWEKIKIPVSIIRSNIGFHHAKKESGVSQGYQNYKNFHPQSSELIMQSLRLFFRYISTQYPPKEPYGKPIKNDENELILKIINQIKERIEKEPHVELFLMLETLINNA